MNRTERLYKICRLLRQAGRMRFGDLQAELEVSKATLKRDLEYLRSRMQVPIVWSRDDGCYRLLEPDPQHATQHELPGMWFSAAEIHALLTMQQLLSDLDVGAVLTPHLSPLIDRLKILLGDADQPTAQLRQRVRIVSLARRPVEPRHFQHLGMALMQRQRVRMVYAARSTDLQTEREVSPQRLVH